MQLLLHAPTPVFAIMHWEQSSAPVVLSLLETLPNGDMTIHMCKCEQILGARGHLFVTITKITLSFSSSLLLSLATHHVYLFKL